MGARALWGAGDELGLAGLCSCRGQAACVAGGRVCSLEAEGHVCSPRAFKAAGTGPGPCVQREATLLPCPPWE